MSNNAVYRVLGNGAVTLTPLKRNGIAGSMTLLTTIKRKAEHHTAGHATLIVFLIGFILVLLSILFAPGTAMQNILLSVGCSLLASSIVAYLTARYLAHAEAVRDLIRDWGLVAIYKTRQEMNRSADAVFVDLEKHLDIIAWGLRSFRDSNTELVRNKIKRGVALRILAPHPESPHVAAREREEGEVTGQIRNTILQLQLWVEELRANSPNPDSVQLRFYRHLPQDFYFRVDDRVFVGPYLYGRSSQQTISFEFAAPSKGAAYYTRYFDSLWNDADFCQDAPPATIAASPD